MAWLVATLDPLVDTEYTASGATHDCTNASWLGGGPLMVLGSLGNLYRMEAQSETWYRKIVSLKKQLENAELAPAERERLELDLLKYERELKTIDDAIDRARAGLGDYSP